MNRLLTLIGACICIAAGLCNKRACADPQIRTVAVSGTLAPDAQGAMFRSFSSPRINNLGHVAFTAQQLGPGIDPPSAQNDFITEFGVWSEGLGSGLELVARADDIAPGTDGKAFNHVFLRDFNDAGQAVIDGTVAGGSHEDQGLWILRSQSHMELIVRENDPAPWINGARFSETGAFGPYFNERGHVIFEQGIRDIPETQYEKDVLEWSDGSVRPLNIKADMALGIAGVSANRIDHISVNEAGHISFAAYLQGVGVTPDNDWAAFIRDLDGGVRLIVREGDVPPGASSDRFIQSYAFQNVSTSRLGFATFLADMAPLPDMASTGTNRGIWSERNGNGLELLVKAGDPLAGEPEVKLHPLVAGTNSFGRVAFFGGLSGPSVTPENNMALLSEGSGTGFEIVARSGSPVPGVADAVFQDLHRGSTVFNNAGQLTFGARISGPGISAANDEGIWAQNHAGIVQLILREGMEIDVDDGSGVDLRTVSAFDGFGIPHSNFNDLGQIAFAVNFTDGTSGIFVSNVAAVPEPTSWLQLLVVGIVFVGIPRQKRHPRS